MRYRKLDADGDYTFGGDQGAFFIDEGSVVAQAIKTRLALQLGEFFLDTTDGTDWKKKILGKYTSSTRDDEIRARINGTPGVLTIETYSSSQDPVTRTWTVTATVNTIYGQVSVEESS